ncbi:hypothetical protein J2T57_000023 [Natronocella acetinitrilica]|uniref:Uncharacterized protein n=1 Tax=Natronocella acetinitrilica TaxID=414046 RepID=A0AAE3G032_9GAMM|nr:hypothetical protein [Natronocella acetinitrilica]MCP1672931.1 hypothetical protein [Natronocella acetinitrilica]
MSMVQPDYLPSAHRGCQPVPERREEDRTIRAVDIPLRGTISTEHLPVSGLGFFKEANEDSERYERLKEKVRRWGGLPWAGIENTQIMASFVRFGTGFFCVGAVICALMLFFAGLFQGQLSYVWNDIGMALLAALLLYGLYRLIDWLIRTDRIPDGKMVIFHRPSGMVRVPGKGKHIEEIPLHDFLPMMSRHFSLGVGGTTQLALSHRSRELVISYHGTAGQEAWYPIIYWEFLQQYMDVTKPIPDVPELENDRWDDPFTRDWDQRHGRPRYWWRGMSKETFDRLLQDSREAARRFPWQQVLDGVPAETAIRKSGWTPSEYAQQPWIAAARIGDDYGEDSPARES